MVGGIVLHGSKVPFLGRSVELCYPRYLFLGWSAELCYTGPRYLFLGWSAELSYTFFSGWGREFCDRPFFRDGVSSFVTEPFFGLGSRVL